MSVAPYAMTARDANYLRQLRRKYDAEKGKQDSNLRTLERLARRMNSVQEGKGGAP